MSFSTRWVDPKPAKLKYNRPVFYLNPKYTRPVFYPNPNTPNPYLSHQPELAGLVSWHGPLPHTWSEMSKSILRLSAGGESGKRRI